MALSSIHPAQTSLFPFLNFTHLDLQPHLPTNLQGEEE